jgi:hypothetical protein
MIKTLTLHGPAATGFWWEHAPVGRDDSFLPKALGNAEQPRYPDCVGPGLTLPGPLASGDSELPNLTFILDDRPWQPHWEPPPKMAPWPAEVQANLKADVEDVNNLRRQIAKTQLSVVGDWIRAKANLAEAKRRLALSPWDDDTKQAVKECEKELAAAEKAIADSQEKYETLQAYLVPIRKPSFQGFPLSPPVRFEAVCL